MKELLQEVLDAGDKAKLPLDMNEWYCGTSCCLCGDVALSRWPEGVETTKDAAASFSIELDQASLSTFGIYAVAESIYLSGAHDRLESAEMSGIFTSEDLKHPHLTTNHSDRAIAHDYVRLIMRKIDEVEK